MLASIAVHAILAYGKLLHNFRLVRRGAGWASVQASLSDESAAGVLIVVRHSRGMLDIAMLHCALCNLCAGKLPACVVHPFFFGSPMAPLCAALNCIPAGDPEALVQAMALGPVLLAPGGSYEMFKPAHEVGTTAWAARPRFAELASRYGWQVVPCCMDNAEYHVWSPLFWTPLPDLMRWAMGSARRRASARRARERQSRLMRAWTHYGIWTPLLMVVSALWILAVPIPVSIKARFGAPLSGSGKHDGKEARGADERSNSSDDEAARAEQLAAMCRAMLEC